jgi:fatty-acid desaturase
MIRNKHLLKVNIPMHLLLVLSLFTINFTWLHLLGIAIIWTLVGGYGIAVGYHRYFSHKSFETRPWIAKILAYLGLMSMDGSLPFWVALHRGVHHRLTDEEADIHAPRHGIFNSFMWWQTKITHDSVNLISARDLMRDPFQVWMNNNYYRIFWGTMFIAALISWQFALGILVPGIILSHHQDNLVNVVGHLPFLGYRNHATDDQSTNEFLTGLFVWGQGWHNNHHARAGDADFGGERWWEFDSAARILIPLIRI